jgi:hypothetical protein
MTLLIAYLGAADEVESEGHAGGPLTCHPADSARWHHSKEDDSQLPCEL